MKRLVLTAALSLACAGPLAFAQEPATAPPPPADTQGPPSGPHHGGMHHPPNPHREAMMLGRRLNLTSDQTSKLEPILADRETRIESLRGNTSLAPADRHQQMKVIREDTESKMAAVLTPDQLTQLKAMREERGHRGPGGPGGPDQAPPPPTT